MIGTRGVLRRRFAARLVAIGVAMLVAVTGVGVAAAAPGSAAGNVVTWRNEGFSAAQGWTTGEIGPYDEGSLVPFRLTVSNPSSTKSAIVGGFALQVTESDHGVAVFDYTTDWAGPLLPSTQDGVVDGMLRTTFPAGLALGPGESATFTFNAHLAVSTSARPAAGMLNGNGVVGFSEVDAAGVGSFGKRVPVKVNACQGTLGTPAIGIVKSSDAPATGVRAGTEVQYTYTITNLGDVALFNAHVVDDQLGVVGDIDGPIEPGTTLTLTEYAVANQTATSMVSVTAYDALGREASATSELTVSVITSARIFGSYYFDFNANGAWDADELSLAGQVIVLSDEAGNVLLTTLTDSVGGYEFVDLTPGVAYVVSALPISEAVITAPAGGMYFLTPAPGQDAGPYDFGTGFPL